MECGKTKCKLEVHHIKPRRLNGSNTVGISLPCVKNAMRKQRGKKNFQSSTKHCKKWMRKNVGCFGNIIRFIG